MIKTNNRYPMLQCWKRNEELNKGRDFKLQCSEGSVVAVLSEGVADPWKCEELLIFTDVS